MIPQILKLDVTGSPAGWIRWQTAAILYSRDRVRWEAGQEVFVFRGGRAASGETSSLSINSIIATDERRNRLLSRKGPASNRELFERDGFLCMYCGVKHRLGALTRDHVAPASRGGDDSWTNLLTACRPCNERKADRTPEEAGMRMLAVPYRPDPAALLLLEATGRKITACQQSWLEATARKRPAILN